MNITALVIQLISGAVGGNVVGSLLSKFNLGPVGNSIAGIIGGGLGGHLLGMLTAGTSAVAAAPTGGLDVASILSSVAGGGVGGAILMAIVGLLKQKFAKA
jgi:uncharacterized membrane protein YeaQ/YmgE (transglycosylase-associated protein family)